MAVPASTMSPVLITGGCGFIGRHLVEGLFEAEPGCRIHVLDINTERNRHPSAVYHKGDVSSAQIVDKVMKETKPLVIFHIACPDSMIILPKLFEKVNVEGTRNIIASATKLGTVRALVFCSSSSVIHDNRTDLIDAKETLPILRPPVQKRVYTLTKATAEEDVIASNRKGGDSSMLTLSLRPCTAIGEADTVCLAKMIPVAQQNKTRFQMGDGKNIYDFVYVGNLADAHILAARALLAAYGKPPLPVEQRADGQSFNITNDERVLFWDFTRKVAAAAGHPVQKEAIVAIPLWVGLLMGWVSEWITWILSFGSRQPNMTVEAIRLSSINRTLDIEKAKRVFGYKPAISLDEGIQRGVAWYLNHETKSK